MYRATKFRLNLRTCLLASAAAVMLPGVAMADDASSSVESVTVSSSRIDRAGFTAPTPETTVTAAEIDRQAPSSVQDLLDRLPTFRSTQTPNTNGNGSLFGGQLGADLRGLGVVRTLVLVDGLRFVPSNTTGTVDLAEIPTLLIDHMDVVTGGASAAWGSDAVAGVVNIILNKNIEGFRATAQYGIAGAGDNEEELVSAAYGTSLLGGRLRFMAGADYANNTGMTSQYTRDWGRKSYGLVTNGSYATNGLPNYIISPNVQSSALAPGGLITAVGPASGPVPSPVPLKGMTFTSSGDAVPFQFGQVYGTSMIGGNNLPNPNLYAQFGKPYASLSGLAHAEYDIADNLTAFIELSGSHTSAAGASAVPPDNAITVHADNAYLPDAVKAAMATDKVSTITVGRTSFDTGPVKTHSGNTTDRVVTGLTWKLGDGWTADANYQYGVDRYHLFFGPNNRILQNYTNAADAVVNPANGQIVCRSSLTSPSNGCIPIDIFGSGNLKLNSYVNGTATYNYAGEQQVADINIHGTPLTLWAGDVSVAAGGEYRKVSGRALPDPVSTTPQPSGALGGWLYGNQKPFAGHYDVFEGYFETDVPLLADLPGVQLLDFDGAVRLTNYSTSGDVVTWKAGLNYQVFDDLRLRATRSHDIRAPNLSELFIGGTGSLYPSVNDPVAGGQVTRLQSNQGNPALQPEVSENYTAGLVYQPSWLPGLTFTADYFDVKVSDVIYTVGGAQIVAGCQSGQTVYCPSIVYSPDGTIAYIKGQPLNLNSLQTSGVDMESAYHFDMADILSDVDGGVSLHALMTFVDHYTTVYPTGPQDTVSQMGGFNGVVGQAKWSGLWDVSYDLEPWTVTLQTRFVGAGVFSRQLYTGAGAINTINNNNVPEYFTFNLQGQYDFSAYDHDMQIYGVVNNLFDKDPPFIPSGTSGGTLGSSTNAQFYDVIGRAFKIGLRIKN